MASEAAGAIEKGPEGKGTTSVRPSVSQLAEIGRDDSRAATW